MVSIRLDLDRMVTQFITGNAEMAGQNYRLGVITHGQKHKHSFLAELVQIIR